MAGFYLGGILVLFVKDFVWERWLVRDFVHESGMGFCPNPGDCTHKSPQCRMLITHITTLSASAAHTAARQTNY